MYDVHGTWTFYWALHLMSFAEMNLADRFAYPSSNVSQFKWRVQIKYHTV